MQTWVWDPQNGGCPFAFPLKQTKKGVSSKKDGPMCPRDSSFSLLCCLTHRTLLGPIPFRPEQVGRSSGGPPQEATRFCLFLLVVSSSVFDFRNPFRGAKRFAGGRKDATPASQESPNPPFSNLAVYVGHPVSKRSRNRSMNIVGYLPNSFQGSFFSGNHQTAKGNGDRFLKRTMKGGTNPGSFFAFQTDQLNSVWTRHSWKVRSEIRVRGVVEDGRCPRGARLIGLTLVFFWFCP